MTSAQTMLTGRRTLAAIAVAAAALGPLLGGCASGPKEPKLTPPREHVAPYDTSKGPALWAVVPLRNESGTSLAEPGPISDAVVAAAAQVRGVRALPLNRTIEAMRALEMPTPRNPDDLKRLAEALGADGVIVGSITAYNPYEPVLGIALALYARPGALDQRGQEVIDTRRLTFQPTDYQYFERSHFSGGPASVVSEHLDGKNHGVQMAVRSYGIGRSDPRTSLGWRRYLKSMDLYTEFAAWHSVGRLLEHEWIRLTRPSRTASATP